MADPENGVITIRAKTGENGTVPRASSSSSPDIIANGKEPLPDPSILTKEENYGNSYDNTVYVGWPNYFYVRGKNFGTTKVEGSWNLFWATPNILLYPFLWEQNQLSTSDGNMNPPFSIEPGAIGASENGFDWVPPDTTDHYCMVAVAVSEGHPNPLAGVNEVSSLAQVLADNVNIAQRNVQLVRGNIPQMVSKAAYTQGDETQTMDLVVSFKNLPLGSSYTIGATTPLDGETLYLEGSDTTTHNFKIGWTERTVPAQWSTLFNYTITFGSDWSGIPEGQHPEVTIRGELLMPATHRLYNHPAAREAEPDLRTGARRLDRAGNVYRVMTAGSVTTLCPDVAP